MTRRKRSTPLVLRITQRVFPVLERWAPFIADRIFRLVFYVPLKYPVPQKEIEVERTGQPFELSVYGKIIRGHRWGDPSKPYVLLVAGWAGRATQFLKFIPELTARGFQVIGPNGPAHGKSDGIRTSSREFEWMFNELFLKFGPPAGIITHSFGGAAVLHAATHGLPVGKLVNIACPAIGDEILKNFLRALNGTWASAERFKRFVLKKTGKPFEEFTALHAISNLPRPVDLLMINDELDTDVVFRSAEEMLKAYPSAKLLKTTGLGHTRILQDENVIAKTVDFIANQGVTSASGSRPPSG